jgi:hypothetical protein
MIQTMQDRNILVACVNAQRDALGLLVAEVEKTVLQVTERTLKQLRQDYQVVLKTEPKKVNAKELKAAKKRIRTMLEDSRLLLTGCLERGLRGAVPREEKVEESTGEEVEEFSGDDDSDLSDF